MNFKEISVFSEEKNFLKDGTKGVSKILFIIPPQGGSRGYGSPQSTRIDETEAIDFVQ